MQVFNSLKQLEEHIFIEKLSQTDYEYCVIKLPKHTPKSSYAILSDRMLNNGEPVLLTLSSITASKNAASYAVEVSLEGLAQGL
jgi:hypothetical protein